ncbi:hypothetical protein ACN28I_01640 [Archangium gephyra]|uniref:hypothetical protein n=1 Tax=Archangium gephyra TaxID=48 RepID=UPI003B7D9099
MRVRLLGLCAVAGLVMMVAASAHADWRTGVPMKEAPNDVLEAWGPGRFSVGYAQGAYLFVDGGVARQIHTGHPSAGTYYQPSDDCFITVNRDFGGVRTDSTADGGRCPFPFGAPIIAEGGSVERVMYAPGGGAAAVASSSTTREPYVSGDSIYDAGTLSPMGDSVRIPDLTGVLGVGQVGDTGYALFGTTSSEAAVVWINLSDTTRAETQAQTGTTLGIVQTMDVFSAGDAATPFPYAVVGTQSGAMLQGSISVSLDPIKPVQTLEGPVSDVSMNVGAGGDAGVGFGMAIVVLADGGSQVVSPVPMLSDTKAGTVWRVRSVPESITKAPLNQVVCTGAKLLRPHRRPAREGQHLHLHQRRGSGDLGDGSGRGRGCRNGDLGDARRGRGLPVHLRGGGSGWRSGARDGHPAERSRVDGGARRRVAGGRPRRLGRHHLRHLHEPESGELHGLRRGWPGRA